MQKRERKQQGIFSKKEEPKLGMPPVVPVLGRQRLEVTNWSLVYTEFQTSQEK